MLKFPTCLSSQPKIIQCHKRKSKDFPFLSHVSILDKVWIHTLQGSGIFICELDSKRNIFTMSVPLDTILSCPCILMDQYVYMAMDQSILKFDIESELSLFHSPLQSFQSCHNIVWIQRSKQGLLVLMENGDLNLLDPLDLQVIKTLVSLSSVFIYAFSCSFNPSFHGIVIQKESLFSILTLDDQLQVTETALQSQEKPRMISMDSLGSMAVMYQEKIIIMSNQKSLEISLQALQLEPQSTSIQVFKDYLVVSGVKALGENKGKLVVCVLETRFGCLLNQVILEEIQLDVKPRKVSTQVLPFEKSLLLNYTLVKSEKPHFEFSSQQITLSLDLPIWSLKHVVGKQSIPSMEQQPAMIASLQKRESGHDSEFLKKLCGIKNEKELNQVFRTWICSQCSLEKENCPMRLSKLPSLPLSQPFLTLLMRHCLENPNEFWPQEAMLYLLKTRNVSSHSLSGWIQTLLDKKDGLLLERVIHSVFDLSESEWILILNSICSWKSSELAVLDKLAKKRHFVPFVKSLDIFSLGQEYFIYTLFCRPCNAYFLTQALKSLKLDVVEKLIMWMDSVLMPTNPWDTHDANVKQWDWMVGMFSLLLDAHFVSIILSDGLLDTIKSIKDKMDQEILKMNKYQSRVIGLLKQYSIKEKIVQEEHEFPSHKSSRWKRMMQELEDENGLYSMEVLKI